MRGCAGSQLENMPGLRSSARIARLRQYTGEYLSYIRKFCEIERCGKATTEFAFYESSVVMPMVMMVRIASQYHNFGWR